MTVSVAHSRNVDYPGYMLITGAGGGLGLGLVEYFLARGARNLACQFRGRSSDLADIFKMHDCDPEKHLIRAELTDESDVANLRSVANGRFGKMWALVNLAGGSSNAMIWKMSKSDFLQVVSDNLLSTFLCTREFVPDLRASSAGRIVNVTSVAAFTGAAGASHYSAAKAGIVGLTKAAARELAPRNITVNAIALGYFESGLIDQVPPDLRDEIKARTPLTRLGRVAEAAAAVEYLVSENANFVTGQVLHVNGGLYG